MDLTMAASSRVASLFADDDDEDHETTIKINKKFAQDFEARKQRQELKAVKFDVGTDDAAASTSSSSSSEDEDANLLTPQLDVDIMSTVNAVRAKDARIYDRSVRFFATSSTPADDDSDEGSDEAVVQAHKHEKPKRAKDMVRQQVLEQMIAEDSDAGISDDDARQARSTTTTANLAYDTEQQQIRQAFLQSTAGRTDERIQDGGSNDNEDDDMLLVVKSHTAMKQQDDHVQQQFMAEVSKLEASLQQGTTGTYRLVDPKGEVQDGNQFLFDYFKNRAWLDKDNDDDDSHDVHHAAKHNDDDSLEDVEKMENFEAHYNFRFEEAAAAAGTSGGADVSNVAYARTTGPTDSLRRPATARKEKRQARQERKAAERKAKEEQLRRLKNARRAELERKMAQIKAVVGNINDAQHVDEDTMMKLLEGDYDPEQFESLMQQAYSDSYYQKGDAEWKSDADVRNALQHDEDGHLLVGGDNADGALYDNADDDGDGDDNEEAEADEEEENWSTEEEFKPPPSASTTSNLERNVRQKVEDELYKLDYEDIIGDMPTRFKYKTVPRNSFGLTAAEILGARDTTLKQYISLKKIAPYRDEPEHRVGVRKRRKFHEMLDQDLAELQAEYEQNAQAAAAAQKVGSGGEDMRELPSAKTRKRRKHKKGKKHADLNDTLVVPKAEPLPHAEVPMEAKDPGDAELRMSRKRRKRRQQDGNSAIDTEHESQPQEPEVAVTETATLNVPDKGSKQDKAERSDKKQRKKERKRQKKEAAAAVIAGVTAARLDAYGL